MNALIKGPMFWAIVHFLIGATVSCLVVFDLFGLGTSWEKSDESVLGFKVSENGLICICFGAVA